MKKLIAIMSFVLVPSLSFAAQRATLQNGDGNETGTASNPLKVSVSGNQSAGDATFTGLTVTGTISNSKIGAYGPADATFTGLRVTGTISNTKIGSYGSADATFQAVTALDVTFGNVQGTPLCTSAAGQICVCGSCA